MSTVEVEQWIFFSPSLSLEMKEKDQKRIGSIALLVGVCVYLVLIYVGVWVRLGR